MGREAWEIVSVLGDHESYNLDYVLAKINVLVGLGRSRIAVDLSETHWLDEKFLERLRSSLAKLKNAGGQLAFVGPSEALRKLLRARISESDLTILESFENLS